MDRLLNRRGSGGAAAIMSMNMAAHAKKAAVSQPKTQQRKRRVGPSAKLGAAAGLAASSRPKPRRPPSAYSLFFKQERKKLQAGGSSSGDSANGLLDRIIANGGGLHASASSGSNGNASSDDEGGSSSGAGAGRKGGSLSGESSTSCPDDSEDDKKKAALMNELAKTISRKWKALDESSRSVFEALALLERKKYERELEIWNRERKVEEERQAKGKFGAAAAAVQAPKSLRQKEPNVTSSSKRKRDSSSSSVAAEKTKKKSKASSSSATVDPFKSKQILPHMLGSHGRGRGGNRFGVPKHVMEKAFSKSSRGQSRERSQSSSSKKQQQQQAKPPTTKSGGDRLVVPAKVLVHERQQQQAHKDAKNQAKKSQEEVRAARLSALGGATKIVPQPQPSKVIEPEEAKAKDDHRPSLLPSIAAVLGIHQSLGSSSGASPSAAAVAACPPASSSSPNLAKNKQNEIAMASFDNAFDELLFEVTTAPSVQPSAPAQPTLAASAPTVLRDPLTSVMDLVRPLSGDGDAPAASALHAQALASATGAVAPEEYLFAQALTSATAGQCSREDDALLQPLSLSSSKPAAFPTCDALMLQRSLKSRESSIQQATAMASRGHEETINDCSSNSVWPEGTMDPLLAEPTPLGSSPLPFSPPSSIEDDLNSSIADIFGVGSAAVVDPSDISSSPSSLSQPQQRTGQDVEEEEDLEFDDAYAAADADLFRALSAKQRVASTNTTAQNEHSFPHPDPLSPCHSEVGEDDDSPLDKTSIDFLMAVFE